jgi:hypothetical protein
MLKKVFTLTFFLVFLQANSAIGKEVSRSLNEACFRGLANCEKNLLFLEILNNASSDLNFYTTNCREEKKGVFCLGAQMSIRYLRSPSQKFTMKLRPKSSCRQIKLLVDKLSHDLAFCKLSCHRISHLEKDFRKFFGANAKRTLTRPKGYCEIK